MKKALLRAMSPPAKNKWTKISPCIAQIAAMVCFCNLIPAAFTRALDPGSRCESRSGRSLVSTVKAGKDSDLSEDAQLGAPKDEARSYRKMAGRRAKKSYNFLTAESSKWTLLLWQTIGQHIMSIHYHLFNHATWWSHARVPESVVFPEGTSTPSLPRFLDEALNPGLRAVAALTEMLFERAEWTPLCHFHGPPCEWPGPLREKAKCQALKAIGLLWRRLWRELQRYPYLLRGLGEAGQPGDAAAGALQQAQECCLDPGCSLKLRRWADSAGTAELRGSKMQTFIRTMFERSVVTSTFVEREFSKLTHWSQTRQSLRSLAAKAVLSRFAANRRAMLDTFTQRGSCRVMATTGPLSQGAQGGRPKGRPIWRQCKRRGLVNGWTLYKADRWGRRRMDFQARCRQLARAWKHEPPEEKADYARRAREGRGLAALVPTKLEDHHELMESLPLCPDDPWGLGTTGEAGPLHPGALEAHLRKKAEEDRPDCKDSGRSGFRQSAKAWAKRHVIAMPADTMPNAARSNTLPCLAGQCVGRMQQCREAFQSTLRALFLATKHGRRMSAGTEHDLLVLRFSAVGTDLPSWQRLVQWAVVLHHGQQATEGSTLCRLTATKACQDTWQLGLVECLVGPHKKLDLLTETSFVQGLMEQREEVWHVEVAEWDPEAEVPLHQFQVHRLVAVNTTRLERMEDVERLWQVNSQANNPGQQRRRRGRGRVRAAEGGATDTDTEHSSAEESAEAALAPLSPAALAPSEPAAAGTRTPPDQLPALEQYAEPAAPTPPHRLPPLQQYRGAVAPAPPVDRAGVNRAPQARAQPAAAGERILEHFGPFPISLVKAFGGVSGYGVVCGRHGSQCRKQLHMGKGGRRLSDEEVVLRLKRWVLAGFGIAGGEENRQTHLKVGGGRLIGLADGEGEPRLTQLLSERLQEERERLREQADRADRG